MPFAARQLHAQIDITRGSGGCAMNWIFEAYANAYSAATMLGMRRDTNAAAAKKPDGPVSREATDRRNR
jgi:hypothetical protein